MNYKIRIVTQVLLACGALFMVSSVDVAANKQKANKKETTEQVAPGFLTSGAPNWMVEAYTASGKAPLWTESRKNRKRLKAYLRELSKADQYGLDPEDYQYSWLRERQSSARFSHSAALETAASLSFASYIRDIRDGVVDPKIDISPELQEGRDTSAGELLKSFAINPNLKYFFTQLRKDNPVQANLTKAIERYRRLQQNGGWEPLKLSKPVLKKGDQGADVLALAKRLAVEEFYRLPRSMSQANAGSESFTYDDSIELAVIAFQHTRGIEPDGVVGPATLKRLNEPVDALIDSLQLNLERARWLPEDFAPRYILVNIAGFRLRMYEQEKVVDEMRTIVGKDNQQTPVFAGAMEYYVVNPYWNVPESILREEIAPKMAEDPFYLESQNMEIVRGWENADRVYDTSSIDWENLPGRLDFRVRQRAGSGNALGYVKFIFPNEYNVYLHDTPTDHLFDRTERTFSHGCIRLERPFDLARWVSQSAPPNTPPIDQLVARGEREVINLEEEIPVYITYFTAWGEPSGEVYFYDDIYNRDERLKLALDSQHKSFKIASLKAAEADD